MEFLKNSWILSQVILPVLDIGILSFLIYQGYRILVQTRAMQLIRGILIMVFIYMAAYFLHLQTLLWILNKLVPGLVIGVAVVFQPELRKIFTQIGRGNLFRLSNRNQNRQIEAALSAAGVLATHRRGALIVFTRSVGMKSIIETGTPLNADVSAALIMTIFSHDTALHDGAVIIQKGRLVAAGCFLTLSEQADIKRTYGTRHRAALGTAEESDAVVLIVSEETGAISLAYDSAIHYDLTSAELRRRLQETLDFHEDLGEENSEASAKPRAPGDGESQV